MANLTIQEGREGVVFAAKIVPGSSGQTRICGLLDGSLKIKVSAPPEKGKANAAVAALLAQALGLDRRAVELAGGAASPRKEFLLRGLSAGEARRRLEAMA